MTVPRPDDTNRVAQLERTIDDYVANARPTQDPAAVRSARIRAQHLAGLVRDEGPDGIGAYLDSLTLEQLYAVTVTLAAMVPLDTPVADLLGWLDAPRQETAA